MRVKNPTMTFGRVLNSSNNIENINISSIIVKSLNPFAKCFAPKRS